RSDPLFRLAGQRHQNRTEEIDLAVGKDAHDEARGQVSAQAQMFDERTMFFGSSAFDELYRRLDADLAHQPLRAFGPHQRHYKRRSLQRLAELDTEHMTAHGRQS